MKQVVLSPRTGALEVAEVPVPQVRRGTVLVRTAASVVSAGTERLVIELAGKNLVGKARARPDLVREALNKVRRDGLRTTLREAFLRLDQPFPLGYSSAGTVADAGTDVAVLRPGDRVACAGATWAVHAEMAVVPEDLCVPLPPAVSFEAGAFAMLGGIALHGVRRAAIGAGNVAAVIGLGLLGQLTVQLLKHAGCRVIGQDIAPARVALSRELGADAAVTAPDDARAAAATLSGGRGADAVIITAATSSNVPVELAADLVRDGGTIVMVGVTGMNIPRRPYWEKELSFLLSRSSSPKDNADFIDTVATGGVRVEPLITHRFPIERAGEAYALIRGRVPTPHLGVVLEYAPGEIGGQTQTLRSAAGGATAVPAAAGSRSAAAATRRAESAGSGAVTVGVIGAGLFAQTVLLPALRRLPGIRLRTVATQSGLSARHTAERLGFERCSTDPREVLDDPEIRAVVIATRHDAHASLAADALRRGKHVFVEKPLALNVPELRTVWEAHAASGGVLVVGFNRRYSPLAGALKAFVGDRRPLAMTFRVNAGDIPSDHWVYDAREGGGRWLGEAGHFIDVLQYLTGTDPVEVYARLSAAGRPPSGGLRDLSAGATLTATLTFGDGSTGAVIYADGAERAESRERLEVYGAGIAATLDDNRRLTLVRGGRVRRARRVEAARGYREELRAWIAAVRGTSAPPVAMSAYAANTLAGLAALESARTGKPVAVDAAAVAPPGAGRPGGVRQ
ncbi:MAG TPA: bi-domain-containing oxidoreductase [bacterium]|nr:bi-domain-containing oxidoreductase [bacterium]